MNDVTTDEVPVSGLIVESGDPVPLLGVSVEAEVTGFGSRVTLTQRYRNSESQPIEALYVFPLEEGAAVCGFEALIDDIRVVGEVREREEAFTAYDDALAAGHGAYLLDQERPDVFTASIGNLPPGKEVAIRITYVAELALEGEAVRFVLPTTVSPRYAPLEDRQGVGKTPAEALNPPLAWNVPYGLEVVVRWRMGSAIRTVESPSHAIAVEIDGPEATVRLGSREAVMDRDFVLLAGLSQPHQPVCRLEKTPSGRLAAMLSFQPDFPPAEGEAPCEVIFVIDRSGSMGGTSIREARNALQLCLRSLSEGARFNIVGFGSTHQKLFPESRAYDQESLRIATEHVSNLHADLGGTEILPALQSVYDEPSIPGLPRQLLILTDGEVTNTEAVIALVRKNSDRARVFSFGIGAGASHHLVRGIARAGEGAAEFIYPGERIEAKVMRQLGKALVPALSGVRVDWGGLCVDQAPYRVPPVFSGGRLLVYGFLEAPASSFDLRKEPSRPGQPSSTRVHLSGSTATGKVDFTLDLDPAAARPGDLIATLAARTKIRDLEEGAGALHDRRGSLQERDSEKAVREELIRLGTTYGLCSRETSFVAVEKREVPAEGELQLRKIPVALTRGWGGLESRFDSVSHPAAAPASGTARYQTASFAYLGEADSLDSGDSFYDAALHPAMYEVSEAAPPAPSRRSRMTSRLRKARPGHSGVTRSESAAASISHPPGYDRLIQLQQADGSWDWSGDLAAILNWDESRFDRFVADLVPAGSGSGKVPGAGEELHRRAAATALALAWLEKNAAGSRPEWQLLARKAERWLAQCPPFPEGTQTWQESARRALEK